MSHFDEPFADSSAIPTWYVSEMARRHVTVVLSGDGGDELFGGYDRYLPHPRVVAFDRYSPRALRRVAAIAAARLPHGVRGKNFLRHVGRDDRGRYLDAIRFFGADEKPALLTADVRRAIDGPDPETRLARHFERFAHLPWPSQMMRFDAETYLPEDVLTKVDRMSMAHSIESRVPLLDNEVIAFASTLPASLKIKNGRRKHVLKEVAATLLPREILEPAQAGLRRPARHLVPRQPARAVRRHAAVGREPAARLLPAGIRPPDRRRACVRQARPYAAAVAARGAREMAKLYVDHVDASAISLPLSAPAFPSEAAIQSRLKELSAAFSELQLAFALLRWGLCAQEARLHPIAVVMTSFEPGGTERQMIELVRRLDPDRWAVHVACFHARGAWFGRAAEAAASVAEFPARHFQRPETLRHAWAFARWCRAKRIAIVHTSELYSNIFGLPGAALAGVPVRIGNRREINPG